MGTYRTFRKIHVVVLLVVSLLERTSTFSIEQRTVSGNAYRHNAVSTTCLSAKKAPNNKKKGRPSTSGFGGAATESCPCGSEEAYMKCCGKLHKKIPEFMKATPEQVVRARYSAYAKREIDFIIKSTHPKNKNFDADIKHWRKQIDMNCYDNFELTKCEILDHEIIDDKTATVTFVANMIQRDSREKTAFMEKSTFEKIGGAWLYKEGEIGDPPGREKKEDEDENAEDKVEAPPTEVEAKSE